MKKVHRYNKQELELREVRLRDHILHLYLKIANDKKCSPALRMSALDRASVIKGLISSIVLHHPLKAKISYDDLKKAEEAENQKPETDDIVDRRAKEWDNFTKGGDNGERNSH